MKVSVIIPCYNVQDYISKAVESLYEQTHQDLEIICVNDGSTDDTLNVLKKLEQESPRDFKLINQENGGASAARNTGLDHATGDYIQFLDGDDYLLRDKIKTQVEIAEKNNLPDIIVGGCKAYDENDKFLFERKFNSTEDYNVWLMLLKTNLGNTCANLFKSTYFNNGGRWNTAMKSSQDYTLMFGILKESAKVVFEESQDTILIRRTSDSISHQNFKENWIRYIELRMEMLKHIIQSDLDVPMQEAYQIIFDAIRIFYKHDKKLALEYYIKIIPEDFVPSTSVTTGSTYIKLFKLLGFKRTQWLQSLFSKVKKQEETWG